MRRYDSHGRLQETINRFTNEMGYAYPPVGILFEEQQLERIESPAFSIGVNVPRIDLPYMTISGIYGPIGVWNGLYDIATEKEIEFYIAHEFSHLSENHFLTSFPIELIKRIIPDKEREMIDTVRYLVDSYFRLYNLFYTGERRGLDIEAEIVKQKELEADKKAVELIGGDGETAISALSKLVSYNIDATSHYIVLEIGKTSQKIPALTIRDRIEQIERLYQ
ncbi:MAG: M48 family metalloprotease [Nitrospiraceae bacterium]|nr:M48 family metalloprotease [Nitrospiraceae bacterium]